MISIECAEVEVVAGWVVSEEGVGVLVLVLLVAMDPEELSVIVVVVVVGGVAEVLGAVVVGGGGVMKREEGKFAFEAVTKASKSRGSARWVRCERQSVAKAARLPCRRVTLLALHEEATLATPKASSSEGMEKGEERDDEDDEDDEDEEVACWWSGGGLP